MKFETAGPVTHATFFNRRTELRQLLNLADDLRQDTRRWYALLGPRKIGKSSLLLEFQRRLPSDVVSVHLDCWEIKLDPHSFFWQLGAGFLDDYLLKADLAAKTGLIAHTPVGEVDMVLAKVELLGAEPLTYATRTLRQLRLRQYSSELLRAIVDLPQRIAEGTGVKAIVIIDEFQEIAKLNQFKIVKETVGDIYALLRARWQQHRDVAYIIAGSRMTMLREQILDYQAPFFQHFSLMPVEPFAREDAVELLQTLCRESGKDINEPLCEEITGLIGTNPFYLQVLGQGLCEWEPEEAISSDTLKVALQRLVFNGDGRLSLYFQKLLSDTVQQSRTLEAVLLCLTEKKRLVDIARELHVTTGTAGTWLKRLLRTDIVEKTAEGLYQVPDPCFRLWLSAQGELPTALPPLLIGDETEKLVARTLARQGFRLVYQSRASRGAFDLLAILQSRQIGIQCRKATLPYYLSQEQAEAMRYWADQLGWLAVLALHVDDGVYFYELSQVVTGESSSRIDETTPTLGSLLELLRPNQSQHS